MGWCFGRDYGKKINYGLVYRLCLQGTFLFTPYRRSIATRYLFATHTNLVESKAVIEGIKDSLQLFCID